MKKNGQKYAKNKNRKNHESKYNCDFYNNIMATNNNSDSILFGDDTNIELKILKDVKYKLYEYDGSGRKMGRSINWAKLKG